MKDFFSKVLPDQGVRFVIEHTPRGFIHHSAYSFDDMETQARASDGRGNDTYFACASYKQEKYTDANGKVRQRTADNVASSKTFYLDIDCGAEKAETGKGYATINDGAKAISKFVNDLGLPRPLVIGSGGGMHIYWPLSEPITKENWKATADQLKSLAQSDQFRLLADPARTADIASILRPIGTHNYKPQHGGAEVRLLIDAPQIEFGHFRSLVSEACRTIEGNVERSRSSVELGNLFPSFGETPDNIQLVKSALSAIDPDCDRDFWFEIVTSVKSTGWSCAEELARQWSRGDYK